MGTVELRGLKVNEHGVGCVGREAEGGCRAVRRAGA